MIVYWAVLSLSFFNTICLGWLGFMVLLVGSRRHGQTWLVGLGLLVAAVFFTSHTAILGRGLATTAFGMDFWWWMSWAPAVAGPWSWYAALWSYAADRRRDRPALIAISLLAAGVVALLLLANPLPSYAAVAERQFVATPSIAGIPVLVLAYVGYSAACYLLPIHLLLRRRAPGSPLNQAANDHARPFLVGSSVALLGAGVVLGVTAVWALRSPEASLADPAIERAVLTFDLLVQLLIAASVTLLGRAIVGAAVFTGQVLPRRGFFRQWRSTVLFALAFGGALAAMVTLNLRPLNMLLLATGFMVLFYALYSWRSSVEQVNGLARLRPFLASTDLLEQVQAAGREDADQRAAALAWLEQLCRVELNVPAARLVPVGALRSLAGAPLEVGPLQLEQLDSVVLERLRLPLEAPERMAEPGLPAVWLAPLRNRRGLAGVLLLADKANGALFTEEELDLAQAGGARVLDMLAGTNLARLTVRTLRERLAEVRVLENRGRRELHDQILPDLHAALLTMDHDPAGARAAIADVHRRISDLIHDLPPAAPQVLAEHGLATALRALPGVELQEPWIAWQAQDQPDAAAVEACAARIAPLAAEVGYHALRELLRNTRRHAGGPLRRPLRVSLLLRACPDRLEVVVEDDGVGWENGSPGEAAGGAGGGIRFHSAMLAAIGGGLEVSAVREGGTRAMIWLPV